MRGLEAQVGGGRAGAVCGEDGVGQFEEGVAPTVEAFVERAAETVESIGTFHDAPIMHLPTTLRIPYLPVELKRKLRRRHPWCPPQQSRTPPGTARPAAPSGRRSAARR